MTIDLYGQFGTDPVANVARFMKAAKAGQTLDCSKPMTVPIGGAGTTSGPLINIPSTVIPDWQLDNLNLLVAPNQAVNAPSTNNQAACVLQFGTGSMGGNVNISIDGNGANQYTATTLNPYGYYMHGVRIFAPKGTFRNRIKIRNIRGVTGISNIDANGVARAETFDHQILGGSATGHVLDLDIATVDGSSPASGAVGQLMTNGTVWYLKLVSDGARHGMGGWGGGIIYLMPGTHIKNAGTGMNIEAGTMGTPVFRVDGPSSSYPVIIENCGYGMVINGNNPNLMQVEDVTLNNVWFLNNNVDIGFAGKPGKKVNINSVLYSDPTTTSLRFMGGSATNNAAWASTVYHASSHTRYTKNQPISLGASLVAANGVPTPLAPTISATDVAVVEGDNVNFVATIALTLSDPSPVPVSVDYATSDGTAVAGSDYTATQGTASFSPWQIAALVDVPVTGDTLYEGDETFSVVFSNPVNAALATPAASVTIANNDPKPIVLPVITGQNVTVTEGTYKRQFTVTFSLSKPSSSTVSFDFATVDGTAVAALDYVARTGSISFAPGQITASAVFQTRGGRVREQTEYFTIRPSNPIGATLGPDVNVAILDND